MQNKGTRFVRKFIYNSSRQRRDTKILTFYF